MRAVHQGVRVAFLLFFAALPLHTQEPIPVSVQLAPREITVGDRVEANVTLVWEGEAPTSEPRFPTWQETWGEAEILEVSPVEAYSDPEGRRVYNQTLTLTTFEVGDVTLPRQVVAVPLAERTVEVPTGSASFTVTSVLPPVADEERAAGSAAPGSAAPESALEPRPPAPLRELEVKRNFLLSSAGLALLLGASIFWLLRRLARLPAAAGMAAPPPPPLDELRHGLETIDPALAEPAHTAMSLALRRYLGRRLELHAVESTTSEIQRGLRGADVGPTLAQRVVRLLRDCDRVKFAQENVDSGETVERLDRVRLVAHELEEGFVAAEEAWEDEEEAREIAA